MKSNAVNEQLDTKIIRLRKGMDVSTICNEIVECLRSGNAAELEIIGARANFLALLAMNEAKKRLTALGNDIEIRPDFKKFPIWDSADSEKITGIKWAIKLERKQKSQKYAKGYAGFIS